MAGDLQVAEQEARRTLAEWERAKQEADAVRGQFVFTGPVDASGRIGSPERVLDTAGMAEIQQAEAKVREKWEAHQQTIMTWREL